MQWLGYCKQRYTSRVGPWAVIFLNSLFVLPFNSHLVNYADDNHICMKNENLEVRYNSYKMTQTQQSGGVIFIKPDIANSDKFQSIIPQIAKFMGPTLGPPGSFRPQMGPKLAPWTLLSGTISINSTSVWTVMLFGVEMFCCHWYAQLYEWFKFLYINEIFIGKNRSYTLRDH